MAKLFSHKLLQETIATIQIPSLEEKIAVLQSWVNAIHNESIKKKTESECEQAFNMDIFHKVLGYTLYPTEQYTIEAKGGNEISGQKADATLGHFTTSTIEKNVSLVQVAVEIKDANTALEKSQRREGNLSPVQQGFKYKPQYTNCKRVIVTNFLEIRLYKDTQLDYEIWQLTDLVNPENDFQNFKIFWYVLSANNLISSSIGNQSITEKMLSAVRLQTEQITKKFYQEYKTLRLELINDIRSNNPTVTIDIVLPKAQKIIDRIVFVHFCEDFGLLPEGKLAEVIQYSEQLVGVTIWQILSGFFEAVNSGSQKLGIPNGYNGGLFHEDKELNDLKIGDTICRKFVELGKYDFQEDLSVNILGHIFEQSISDLEDLRINMLGAELETGELGESTKSNKRKKDGIFYTPEYIVDYIVKNSLGKYLEEQFEAIEKKHLKNEKQMSDKVYKEKQKLIYGEYKQVLENITVLDPACGSGAFLVNVFDYLLAEHKRIGEALGMGSLFDNESTYKSILQNNIYGVDLNSESVEITKLSLWLKTAEKGKKLADLDKNIKCGNSLIDDPGVAGEKAFDRHKEFASIMNKGGFDVIVGNPPYVTLFGKQKIDNNSLDIEYYKQKYISFEYKVNTFVLFIEKSLSLLHKGSSLSFIIPDRIFTNLYFTQIRKIIYTTCKINEIIYLKGNIFSEAVVDTIILNITKGGVENGKNIRIGETTTDNQFQYSNSKINEDGTIIFKNKTTNDFLTKLSDNISLQEITKIYVGVVTGDNKKFLSKRKEGENRLPIVKGADMQKYYASNNNNFIYWKPEELHSNTDEKVFFSSEKLLVRKTGNILMCAFDDNKWISEQTIYNLILKNESYSLKYIMPIINSSLLQYYFSQKLVSNTGSFPQIKGVHLGQLPIKNITLKDQQPFIEKADAMLALHKQLQDKIEFTLRFLQSKFGIAKVSNKLSSFRELDFSGFVKELNCKKLPLDTEAELMRYFEKEKAEIVALKEQINTLDKQIDDMVFDLYGLTGAERKVVLES